jgi:hypothetical protein
MSARSIVQVSGAPAWLRAAVRDSGRSQLHDMPSSEIHRLLNFVNLRSIVCS